MKDVVKFLLFILYSTSIFFLPNNSIIVLCILFNFIIIGINKISIKRTALKCMKFIPFIILTLIFNCLMGSYIDALWIAVKLLIVCNITMIYSETTSITRSSRNYKNSIHTIKNNKYKSR